MRVATSSCATDPLRLIELPDPKLRPHDLRVRVKAIGVNPVDWKMRSGGPIRLAYRFVGPSGPLVVGIDFAGEVLEAGAEADLKAGARVVGATDFSRGQRGSYADQVVVRDDQCAALPDSVSFEDAACLPVPGATALRGFEVASLATIEKGKAKVLVIGASGGVGQATIQLARGLGAKAFGICSGRNVALVEKLGAVAIDYTQGDALAAAAGHGPFDLILNAVGTENYPLEASRKLLTPRGKIALVAVRPADWPAMAFASNVVAVLGRPNRKMIAPLVAAMVKGELALPIEKRFPLAEAEQAHQLSQGAKVVGKLLLIP